MKIVSNGAICGILSSLVVVCFWVAPNFIHQSISNPYVVYVAIPVVLFLALLLAVVAFWKSSRWWMLTIIGILITGIGYLSVGE